MSEKRTFKQGDRVRIVGGKHAGVVGSFWRQQASQSELLGVVDGDNGFSFGVLLSEIEPEASAPPHQTSSGEGGDQLEAVARAFAYALAAQDGGTEEQCAAYANKHTEAFTGPMRDALAALTNPQTTGVSGEGLHPATADLVQRFSTALADKLRKAEQKYGYSDGWLSPDWQAECQRHLAEHVAKGDPRDVAAYAAFCWHHGWSTASPPQHQGLAALREIAAYQWPVIVGHTRHEVDLPNAGEVSEVRIPVAQETALQAFNKVQEIARTALAALSQGEGE